MASFASRFFLPFVWVLFPVLTCCSGNSPGVSDNSLLQQLGSILEKDDPCAYSPAIAMLTIPRNPKPGESFRILSAGGKEILNARLEIRGPSGSFVAERVATGHELPFWRVDKVSGTNEGSYRVVLMLDDHALFEMEFSVSKSGSVLSKGSVWKTQREWDSRMETLYSAWINALFQGADEQSSWKALHELTQNKDRNLLHNYLSLNEDVPDNPNHVIMEPDCADNPFFLRAYFSWKLGLPFGFHLCDRGYLGKNPQTGQWVTNESPSSKTNQVAAFNMFIRRMMDGVHSGTARTSFLNDQSDYYPVSLDRFSLRPGTVFADPYGHTLILVSWIPQTKTHPGRLLAVDAQPDKTIAIKRFWKGNFLFNTSDVVGEPGFKAFRPILIRSGKMTLLTNKELTLDSGFVPFSDHQRKMEQDTFYLAMDRLINPKPLDPEEALNDLVHALHEQLLVRVKSVSNGESYLKKHPGTVIPMPSSANGVFLAGGPWEDFSTPNRDLRLLIAMDAVLDFPERVSRYPRDFKVSGSDTPDEIKSRLTKLLQRKVSDLSVAYVRSDGSSWSLSLTEILNRRDAFEMAYNPNDGVEIRWGAPEKSEERSTCQRKAPPHQLKTMQSVRKWFVKRLHPPT